MFTDSHCHLTYPELADNIVQVRAAMAEAQVDRALCICTTLEEFDAVQSLAARFDNFWASVGVHPDNEDIAEPSIDDLVRRSALPKVVAIGETGLDYYQMAERKGGRTIADMEWQRDHSRSYPSSAAVKKPLVIHTRDASADTLAILKEEGEDGRDSSAGGVFHCFTETAEVARCARSGFLYFFLRHPDIQESPGYSQCRRLRAAGPHVDRDRQPVPRAHSLPRQDQQSGVCAVRCQADCRASWNLRRSRSRGHQRQLRDSIFRHPMFIQFLKKSSYLLLLAVSLQRMRTRQLISSVRFVATTPAVSGTSSSAVSIPIPATKRPDRLAGRIAGAIAACHRCIAGIA